MTIDLTALSGSILFVLGGRIGRDNAMKREELDARLCAMDPAFAAKPWATRDRATRKAIERCCPWVCSCACGYYFPETGAEVVKAERYLVKKIYGLCDRRRAIRAHYRDMGQNVLELRP